MFPAFANMFQPVLAAPELEVISHEPHQPVSRTPLLFVHGAYAGAWCWEEFFLPYLARQGFSVHAVSLRGHGRSGGHELLHQAGLRDYVADLRRTIQALPRPPVLIGHSMGGMVVQKYLERYQEAPAAVLMASVPPSGLGAPTLQLMLGDPWLFTQIQLVHGMSPHLADMQTARRAVFSDDLPDEELYRYMDRFQGESQRAIWDMMMGDLPRLWKMPRVPMLVMGAEQDGLFTPAAVRETAAAYGTEAVLFPEMNHAMMLERNWQDVADYLVGWLLQQPLE